MEAFGSLARKDIECWKWNLTGYYSRTLEVSHAEKSVSNGAPAQEDSEGNKDSISNWTRGHFGHLAAFCLCLESLSRFKYEHNEVICVDFEAGRCLGWCLRSV